MNARESLAHCITKIVAESGDVDQRRSSACSTYECNAGRDDCFMAAQRTSTSVSDDTIAMLLCPFEAAWNAWRNILRHVYLFLCAAKIIAC